MIARKTWQEVRVMTAVYFLLLELMLVGAILYWPDLARDLARKAGALEALMPAEFLKRMVRDWASDDSDVAYRAYIATQQFFKGINVCGIAIAVLLGTGIISRERETGTLEMLLSRPISRARVLWSKTWVVALCVVVPIYLSSLSVIPLSAILPGINSNIPAPVLLEASTHASLFVLMFLAATVLLSTFMRTQVAVAFTIGGFVIAQVGIYFIQVIRVGSVFMLSDHETYSPIIAGNVSWKALFFGRSFGFGPGICLILVILALFAGATWLFKRLEL